MATALGLWLGDRFRPGEPAPVFQALLAYPEPRALSPFDLQASDGSRLNAERLRGRYSLLFFGFTHCPDVCPAGLAAYRQIEQVLAATRNAPAVNLVFVSVDPERDQLQVLGDYAHYFSPRIIAATGPDSALLPFTRELGVIYARQAPVDGGYSVDHSAQFVLLDPMVRMIGIFRAPPDPAAISADLVRLPE
ncbi:MAG: SCO family protein [Lysobacterales bacterium]